MKQEFQLSQSPSKTGEMISAIEWFIDGTRPNPRCRDLPVDIKELTHAAFKVVLRDVQSKLRKHRAKEDVVKQKWDARKSTAPVQRQQRAAQVEESSSGEEESEGEETEQETERSSGGDSVSASASGSAEDDDDSDNETEETETSNTSQDEVMEDAPVDKGKVRANASTMSSVQAQTAGPTQAPSSAAANVTQEPASTSGKGLDALTDALKMARSEHEAQSALLQAKNQEIERLDNLHKSAMDAHAVLAKQRDAKIANLESRIKVLEYDVAELGYAIATARDIGTSEKEVLEKLPSQMLDQEVVVRLLQNARFRKDWLEEISPAVQTPPVAASSIKAEASRPMKT